MIPDSESISNAEKRELDNSFVLNEWVLDCLALAYDSVGHKISDASLGMEAGELVSHAAGDPELVRDEDACYSLDQIEKIFEMTMDRVRALTRPVRR